MSATDRSWSLTQRTLWQVAARIGIVVAVATVVSYWHVLSSLESQALSQLEQYVEQRRARESATFVLAGEHLDIFDRAYRQRLEQAERIRPQFRFDALFERRADGTMRLRERYFGSHGITGFIGKHVEVSGDLRNRLVVAFDVLAQYGPAWRERFANLYVITPENAVLMFWPEQPWALSASDWEVYGKLSLVMRATDEVLVLGETDAGSEDMAGWSDLYFDYGVNDWMVSSTEPIEADGRHLLSVGQDVLLSDLIERAVASELSGTYNVIFREDGRLIAHPRFMEAIQAQSGALTIAETGDPHLLRIYDIARQRQEGETIVDNEADQEFLAVTQLQGPDWYLMTVFPKAIVADRALGTARLILILGIVALVFEIGILFIVLRKQVAEPLRHLIGATRRLASGQFAAAPELQRHDEIGELARSFNAMAEEIEARQTDLNERRAALADLNERLQRELEERKRAEAELARQREALYQSEKMNALGSLLAGVAHELNNPLSVVVGRSIMLEEQLGASPQAKAIGKVRQAAERCSRIVRTFLAMARQQAPSRLPVPLREVVDSAFELVGYRLRNAGVEVAMDIPADLPRINADPGQLSQVFTNLLVNAEQALADRDGPRRVRLTARLTDSGKTVRIQLDDNGPGIPKDVLPRVFEPFFTTKPSGAGTGVGLSVCYGIVEAHGGTIRACEAADGGACFIMTLPVAPAGTDTDQAEPCAPQGPDGRRLLIVDDELEIRRMLEDILRPDRHVIETAANGQQALARLAERPYDLIVSDLVMPEMDGPALFREIRRRHPELAERVIFVTGDTLSPAAKDFLDAAGQPFIDKPFVPKDVRKAVWDALEGLPA